MAGLMREELFPLITVREGAWTPELVRRETMNDLRRPGQAIPPSSGLLSGERLRNWAFFHMFPKREKKASLELWAKV